MTREAAILFVLAACFSPSIPEGRACASNGECPPGQQCHAGLCVSEPPPDGATDASIQNAFVPSALQVTNGAGGVAVIGRKLNLVPTWARQAETSANAIAGTISSVELPAGFSYTVHTATTTYTVDGDQATCSPVGCYSISIAEDDTKDRQHVDAIVQEDLADGSSHRWILHVGPTFEDVSETSPYFDAIEAFRHHQLGAGCTATTFCPNGNFARRTLARVAGVVAAKTGISIPTSGTIDLGQAVTSYDCSVNGRSAFDDVSPGDAECPEIHFLVARGVLTRCEEMPSRFCPTTTSTRAELGRVAAGLVTQFGPVPSQYVDPLTQRSYQCSLLGGSMHFTDVSLADCPAVHYLWARGAEHVIVPADNCATTSPAFCPTKNTSREAAAELLVSGVQLLLYGP